MFTQPLLNKGIINVPLFKPAYTPVSPLLSTNGFRTGGWYPQCDGGTFLSSFFSSGIQTQQHYIGIPRIAGLSQVLFHNSAGGGQIVPFYHVGSEGFAMGILVFDGTTNGQWYNPQPLNPGTWGVNNAFSIPDATFSGSPGVGPSSPNYGMLFWDELGQGPFPGYMTDGTPFGAATLQGHIFDPVKYPGGHLINCMTLPYLFTGGLSTVNYYQTADPGSGLNWGFLDAVAGNIVPRQIAAYRSTLAAAPAPLFNNNVVFDNPTLETAWNTASGWRIVPWKGGWIIILFTNRAGPTGQLYEIAVANPAMSSYNLINFVPQESTGATALNRTGAGFGWQVMIDPDGILWFNSGNGADNGLLWFSYSPPLWPYPQFTFTPSSFDMPCYTPCWPVTPY